MAIISGIGAGLVTGITLLLALVFVEYAKLREKSEKAFVWIGAGAVSFILGGVFKALEDTVWAEAGIEETIGLYGLYPPGANRCTMGNSRPSNTKHVKSTNHRLEY